MKKIFLLAVLGIFIAISSCTDKSPNNWTPAPNPLMTRWAAEVDPVMPWPEYPRPQMVREEWINLNGLWDYQIMRKGAEQDAFIKSILVPYPVESSLSGIGDSVGPEDIIIYRRMFEVPGSWQGKQIMLHFEAVDWETHVFVNGKEAGTHKGGYDPFYFDISDIVDGTGTNELVVKVSDPTSEGPQPRGKQVLNPHGIWYTPTSGIWQTVWLEPVSQTHIKGMKIIADPGEGILSLDIACDGFHSGDKVLISIMDQGETIEEDVFESPTGIRVPVTDVKSWSPDDPHLYDLSIRIIRENEELDRVSSYFGMRKIEKRMADDGFVRLFLNGEVCFQNGPLDQGFWPDGLYTPPTDEAMRFDIEMTKKMGFNMLRKHVKVENRRFYYWCDKLGIMVWQDMPSTSGYVAPDKEDLDRPLEEKKQFRLELERMITTRLNHPSIVMWVPFNEGWGQFETIETVDYIYSLDPTRLVNNTSGWADRGAGDVIDIHHYPDPRCPAAEQNRASVLGEFGGLGLFVPGHTWEEKNWGYRKMIDSVSLLLKYEQFYTKVWEMAKSEGLSASVYTQTTDVETETNGLMTYDRAVVKIDAGILNHINTGNYLPAPSFADEEGIFNKSVEVRISAPAGTIRYTLDGSLPGDGSTEYDDPFSITRSETVTVAAFEDGRQSLPVAKTFTITEKKPLVYLNPFDNRYTGGGSFALVDGNFGSLDYSDGKWQGFRSTGLDAVVDLGVSRKISGVSANFLVNHESWTFLPPLFRVYTSDDMKSYTLQGEVSNPVPDDYEEAHTQTLTVDGLEASARYIRVTAETAGAAPEWLKGGKGKPTWIFVDEVVIK